MSALVMMGDSEGEYNFTGDEIRADEWFGTTGGYFTVAIHIHNLRGRVYVEASLAEEPTENDWFSIWLTPTTSYVQYPRDLSDPTGSTGDTGVEAYNFEGNFTWLRTRLDRSYMTPEPESDEAIAAFGVVQKILLNR